MSALLTGLAASALAASFQLPVIIGPAYHDMMGQVYADYRARETRSVEEGVVLRRIQVPRRSPGEPPAASAIVRRSADRKALQEYLEARFPDLPYLKDPGSPLVKTADEHLALLRRTLAAIDRDTGRRDYLKLDLKRVRARLDKDLAGRKGVVYVIEPSDIPPFTPREAR